MWDRISDRVEALKPSAIRKFFSVPDDVITLGIGEPDFDAPQPVIEASIKALRDGKTHYTSNAGIPELRSAICEKLTDLYGVHYDMDQEIIITVGASEALFLAVSAVINPGDEMIVVTPCFVSYQAAVQLCGGKAVEVACTLENNFDLDVAAIEAAITPQTRGILMGFPSNPTGAVAARETLQKVVDLAQKHDLAIVSDEIYDRLVYGAEHVSVPSLKGGQDRTILIGGFSKSYAMTGYRIGYIACPRHICTQIYKIHQYLIMSAPTIAQYAAVAAICDCEEDVQRMRREYDRRRRLVVDGFNALGLRTFEPKGAFYAFPLITESGLNCEDFAVRLLNEEKVALIPGAGFGTGAAGHVRVAYAQSYENIEIALLRIEKFVKKL